MKEVNRKNYPKSQNWGAFKLKVTKANGYESDRKLQEDISGATALKITEDTTRTTRLINSYGWSDFKRENGFVEFFIKSGSNIPHS